MSLQQEEMILLAVVVFLQRMVAALTSSLHHQVQINKGVLATHLSMDAALMESLLQEALVRKAVLAKTESTAAALIEELLLLALTLKVAAVQQVCMAAVQMVTQQQKGRISWVVGTRSCQKHLQRCVAWKRIEDPPGTSPCDGALTWNMVAALDSGTEEKVEIETTLILKRSATRFALIQLGKLPAIYQLFLGHVKVTTQGTDTILKQGSVHSLLMEDALVTTTNSKPRRNAMTRVWKMSSSRCSQISANRTLNQGHVRAILPAGGTTRTLNSVKNSIMVVAKEI